MAEVANERIAAANAKEKGKTMIQIIRAHLNGEDGRARRENWVPRWMAFPPSYYTPRGGVRSVAAYAEFEDARGDDQPEPPDTPTAGAIEP
ncbi:UNVERIFIED_CONTAM: chromosome partitioning protein ParB, partial [Bacteroidetes bacterium 56_B9]